MTGPLRGTRSKTAESTTGNAKSGVNATPPAPTSAKAPPPPNASTVAARPTRRARASRAGRSSAVERYVTPAEYAPTSRGAINARGDARPAATSGTTPVAALHARTRPMASTPGTTRRFAPPSYSAAAPRAARTIPRDVARGPAAEGHRARGQNEDERERGPGRDPPRGEGSLRVERAVAVAVGEVVAGHPGEVDEHRRRREPQRVRHRQRRRAVPEDRAPRERRARDDVERRRQAQRRADEPQPVLRARHP